MKLNLRRFDIGNISDDSVVVFVGKRRTGKSFLVKDLLYHHRDLPIGTVISGTEAASPFFGDIVPSLFIHDEYNAGIVDNVLKRQKKIKAIVTKQKKETGRTNVDSRAFLLLDDCMYDSSWTRDKNMRCLFMNGRHYNLLLLITMQHVMGIPPNLRTNVDYVFILRENNTSNRRRIYENFAGCIPTFEMFNTIMDQCTENYECLVIAINATSNRLEDQLFWYKASSHEPFRVGAKEFWDAHEEHMARGDEEEDGDAMFDPSQLRNKRGPTININKRY